jgi:hypothetical protein
MADGSDVGPGDRCGDGRPGGFWNKSYNTWHSDHSGVIMAKSKSKPGDDSPKRKPRRARSLLSPDEIRDLAERSSEKFSPLRLYLKTDYNLELDLFRDESFVMNLLRLEFRLTRGDVGALTLSQVQYLVEKAHHYNKPPTPEERRRVLAEVAERRTKLANLPNPSSGEAALLKALGRFPAPQAEEPAPQAQEEDLWRDYMPFQEALHQFLLTASQLSKACKSGRVRSKGKYKGRVLVHIGDLYVCYGSRKGAEE